VFPLKAVPVGNQLGDKSPDMGHSYIQPVQIFIAFYCLRDQRSLNPGLDLTCTGPKLV